MKVKVYFNLHKKVWSVMDYQTKRVIAHMSEVNLIDATFKVSQAGRNRVLREKKKNVHAFVVGYLVDSHQNKHFSQAYYNPYKVSTFVDKDTMEAISNSSAVHLANDRSVWYE